MVAHVDRTIAEASKLLKWVTPSRRLEGLSNVPCGLLFAAKAIVDRRRAGKRFVRPADGKLACEAGRAFLTSGWRHYQCAREREQVF